MSHKRRTKDSLKTIYAIDDLIMFPLSPQSYQIARFKSARSTLHRKFFLKDLLKQTNHENKIGKVWLW